MTVRSLVFPVWMLYPSLNSMFGLEPCWTVIFMTSFFMPRRTLSWCSIFPYFLLLLHRLLHDLDNYVNEYKALSDTCYNVRAILTHIEYVSPPLPLIDFVEKRSLSPCLRFQSTPLRKFLSKGSNILLRSPCSFSVWILLWLFDFVCLFFVFSPLYWFSVLFSLLHSTISNTPLPTSSVMSLWHSLRIFLLRFSFPQSNNQGNFQKTQSQSTLEEPRGYSTLFSTYSFLNPIRQSDAPCHVEWNVPFNDWNQMCFPLSLRHSHLPPVNFPSPRRFLHFPARDSSPGKWRVCLSCFVFSLEKKSCSTPLFFFYFFSVCTSI